LLSFLPVPIIVGIYATRMAQSLTQAGFQRSIESLCGHAFRGTTLYLKKKNN